MTYRTHVSRLAHKDVDDILQWLNDRTPSGAQAWFQRWLEVLNSLGDRADSYSIAPESKDHPEVIRQAIFKTRRGHRYRALFVIRDDGVYVLHVRGPGQPLLSPDELE